MMKKRTVAGFTLIELLIVMLVMSVLATLAIEQYATYLDRTGPERAARVIASHVALTRGYAVQRRSPVSLVLDATERKLWIRTTTDTIRSVNLGEDSDFRVDTLTMGFPGDSVSFSSRGVCRECGLTGTGIITVAGRNNTRYLVTFNSLGVWKVERQ
jgi:prepilin-type N-terminal cleavage/methylation domain-containing protein